MMGAMPFFGQHQGGMGSPYQRAELQRQQQDAMRGINSAMGGQQGAGQQGARQLNMVQQQLGPQQGGMGQQQGALNSAMTRANAGYQSPMAGMGQQQQAMQGFNSMFGPQQGNQQMGMPGKGLGQQMMGQQGGCPPWQPNCQGGGGGGGGFGSSGLSNMMGRAGLQNTLAAAPAPSTGYNNFGYPTGSTHGPQDYLGTSAAGPSATGTPMDLQGQTLADFNTRFGTG